MTHAQAPIAAAILTALALGATPLQAAEPEVLALRAARIYTAPDAAPIADGVVIVRGATIEAVGPARDGGASVPSIDTACDGGVVVAGFQNSHVHLLGPAFEDARTRPAADLERGLDAMLTRWGFTTAVDIASDRDNTLALRARIDAVEVRGPRILTAGWPLFPHDGLPIYLDTLPPAFRAKLPQPATTAEALAVVRANLDAGVEATKLFIAAPQGRRGIRRMDPAIAAAAADETHRRGRLVFAHPTDLDGVRAALDAGVDILAHPPLGAPAPWPQPLMDRVRAAGMAMIPTLKLLPHELAKENVPADVARRIVDESVQEFGRFAAAGGTVLFGTDVDYMTDLDPTDEYALMARAGMSPMQILAALTTAPAARWNESGRRGRVAPGQDADLVVLDADPAQDARRFAAVRCVVRGGRLAYTR